MGGMEVGQVAQAPAITSKAVDAERSLENIISSIFRWAVRPLVSLYCALENKILTGKPLTTTNVLPETEEGKFYRVEGGDACTLEDYKKAITKLKPNSHVAFHLGCKNSIVRHSTALVIGKDSEGKLYALFFNANGASPGESKLEHQDLNVNIKEGTTKHLETAQAFYEEMMEGVENPPEPLYSSADIQADRVSCTAYTAIFLEAFEAAAETDGFNRETFMQDVANGRLVTHAKARAKLSETAKKVAAQTPKATPHIPKDLEVTLDPIDDFTVL